MYSESLMIAPIYTLIVATTVFAVLFGVIFKDMLEYQVRLWTANPESQGKINYNNGNIIIAYCGTTLFVFFSVALSLTVFLQLFWLAAIIGFVVVIPTALLMWVQLGSMLQLWGTNGIEAVDLDFFALNQPSEKSTEPLSSQGK
ncbi:hypothetical protein VB834_09385 [Limnoraphis robusta Tam1]|uniref:hypothetical protein n=1 Tax=Limnoraphis robusta TaxID=1118279 RepID=UPI002B1F5ED9|nr:hypothetical protein [Limnoraphis robusta]MEA5498175.1 hypothetical protein [Limnoraphis robusta BA-68 BA1]MEA5539245.1 hypothetical protein [Limnoraphis robusta Tam1]